MKVYEIIPDRLYQRGRFDHWPEERIERELLELDIGVVATLIRSDLRIPRGVIHFYLPIADGKISDREGIEQTAHSLAKHSQYRRVLIHCNAGRNRSGLMSALVARQLLNLTGAEALEYVRSKRPRAIANPHFEEYLRSLP